MTCLHDIKVSIDSVQEYIGTDITFTLFQKNKILRRAIEREIEIIGEATNRILKIDPQFKLENSRKIIDTRNWVIHSYDNVDEVIIWGIVINHLPKLKQEVEQYLGEE